MRDNRNGNQQRGIYEDPLLPQRSARLLTARSVRWLILIVISLGALSNLASSCGTAFFFDRAFLFEEDLYLVGWPRTSFDGEMMIVRFDPAEKREQNIWIKSGAKWLDEDGYDSSESPAPAVAAISQDLVPEPVACLADDSGICYRIEAPEQVSVSRDNGASWTPAWTFPANRRALIDRLRSITFAPCEGPFYDRENDRLHGLTVLGSPEAHFVVATYGEEGVLVKSPAGRWERVSLYAANAPVVASDRLATIYLAIAPEVILLTIVTGIALIGFFHLAWPRQRLSLMPLLVTFVSYLLTSSPFFVGNRSPFSVGAMIMTLFWLALPVYVYYERWQYFAQVSGQPTVTRRAGRHWLLTGLMLLLAPGPMVLWASGDIAEIGLAHLLTGAGVLLALLFGVHFVVAPMRLLPAAAAEK